MCTVTFIPAKEGVFLTSNRDEKSTRPSAELPREYPFTTGRLLFPRDAAAGGTWISIHENGNAVVFLNGGVKKHESAPPYRKSRGIILLDLIDSEQPYDSFKSLPLEGIEPFTAIIWDNSNLYECRWDGSRKYSKHKDATHPHIWSSVTLYTDEVIRTREQWFSNWLKNNPAPTQNDILKFHRFTGDGDNWNGLTMNRDGETYTVSITSVILQEGRAAMQYLDLRSNQQTASVFAIEKYSGALK